MPGHARLLIASNRLPFTVQMSGTALEFQPTAGGLAAALAGVHERCDDVWVGWPGPVASLRGEQRSEVLARLRDRRIVPVELTAEQIEAYYDAVCNGVLWPVLHYLIDRLPLDLPEFQTYRAVNERFADAIASEYRPGDLVWVHDYHLMLTPAMVRARIPDARIGFFLHTPFPSPDVFRVLPWRRELLEGLLGASLIGFQTARDAANFGESIRLLTGCCADACTVTVDGREVRFAAYPIGIDPRRVRAADPASPSAGGRFPRVPGTKLLVGVDRLDYTKGIPRRLLAFERLLSQHPALHGRVQLLQVAVPTRGHVPCYASFRTEVEAIAAGVNARFRTDAWTPVRFVDEAVPPSELAAIYQAADVMLVTSLRDGMNLVAKEFISVRDDEDGVLVLSELAGASDELSDALQINPYSVDETAAAMATALEMGREERQRRMRALRRAISSRSVEGWVERFTADLTRPAPAAGSAAQESVVSLLAAASRERELSLALSYEGVLIPGGPAEEPASPDPELLEILRRLGTRAGLAVHVVSAADHDTLDRWFDGIPVVVWAEHGLWRREREGHRWRRAEWISTEWMDDVRELLRQFEARTPGAFVEEHPVSLRWHFRRADPVFGRCQAQTLAGLLGDGAGALGIRVTLAESFLEVRPSGLSRVRALQKIAEEGPAGSRLAAIAACGDDVRDALRSSDLLITVGGTTASAALTLPDSRAARQSLSQLSRALPRTGQALAPAVRTRTAARQGIAARLRTVAVPASPSPWALRIGR
jgi:trehalose 6-phosphate synthase/phosphatase